MERRPATSLVGKTIAKVTHVKNDRLRIRFTDGTWIDAAHNEVFDHEGMFLDNDAEWENEGA